MTVKIKHVHVTTYVVADNLRIDENNNYSCNNCSGY